MRAARALTVCQHKHGSVEALNKSIAKNREQERAPRSFREFHPAGLPAIAAQGRGGWSRFGARRPLDDCLTTPARHTRGRVVALLWVATWGCGRAAMDRARGLGFHLVKRAGLLESPVFEHGGRLGQLCGRCAVATIRLFLRLLSSSTRLLPVLSSSRIATLGPRSLRRELQGPPRGCGSRIFQLHAIVVGLRDLCIVWL